LVTLARTKTPFECHVLFEWPLTENRKKENDEIKVL
jgi:hypothetical protein